jgi:DNA-binding response OmpR family regulator
MLMPDQFKHKHARLCLLSDDEVVAAAVRVSCPPPHQVDVFSLLDVVNERNTLSAQGHAIVGAAAGYDAILVDWNLTQAPVINTLCFHVRRLVSVPLIAVCRGTQDTQVAALMAGADEAITFPFYLPLLQAVTTSYHRLVQAAQQAVSGAGAQKPGDERAVLQEGELRLERTAHKCFIGNEEVDLTFREFALLDFFVTHAGVACTRDQILDHVWGIRFDTGTNMVDVYVYYVRRKLQAHGFKGRIQTVRGYGYRFVMADPDAPEQDSPASS